MAIERAGGTMWKGEQRTLVGPELKPGDQAPEATLVTQDLSEVKLLGSTSGKIRLINVILSVDTGICAPQTKRFDEECAKLPNVAAVTVSMDLPFAMKRFCGAENVKHRVLSDHRNAEFGEKYGILVKETRWLGRAIFVVGSDGRVAYAQYCPEIAAHPDYDAALAALQAAK
jgi:thiol peroxidase